MDTLQSLFGIATSTIFTLTAGLVLTFFQLPIWPYGSVINTSRLLRTHHLTTIALVAFSFLVFALLPAGTGFSGGKALQKIWETDTLLYLALFVLGSTVLTIIIGLLFRKLLIIRRENRRLFTDIYNVFVAFTLLWFVVLAALTNYIFELFHAADWPQNLELKIRLAQVLATLGFSDVSDLFVSFALWAMLALSGYFGYLMILRWSLRRGIRTVVRGKDAQKVFSRTVIIGSTAAVGFILIIASALYLALLSATLLKHSSPPPPHNDFDYQASCYVTGNKLHINMMVKNNRSFRADLRFLFIDWDKADKALGIDHGDIFWMSRKGFYFDPSEISY